MPSSIYNYSGNIQKRFWYEICNAGEINFTTTNTLLNLPLVLNKEDVIPFLNKLTQREFVGGSSLGGYETQSTNTQKDSRVIYEKKEDLKNLSTIHLDQKEKVNALDLLGLDKGGEGEYEPPIIGVIVNTEGNMQKGGSGELRKNGNIEIIYNKKNSACDVKTKENDDVCTFHSNIKINLHVYTKEHLKNHEGVLEDLEKGLGDGQTRHNQAKNKTWKKIASFCEIVSYILHYKEGIILQKEMGGLIKKMSEKKMGRDEYIKKQTDINNKNEKLLKETNLRMDAFKSVEPAVLEKALDDINSYLKENRSNLLGCAEEFNLSHEQKNSIDPAQKPSFSCSHKEDPIMASINIPSVITPGFVSSQSLSSLDNLDDGFVAIGKKGKPVKAQRAYP